MRIPSLVPTDLRPSTHRVPSDRGMFTWGDQASPPLPCPLGGRRLAEIRGTHRGTIPLGKGMCLVRETTWAQVKRFSVPIITPAAASMAGVCVGSSPGQGPLRAAGGGESLLETHSWAGKAISRTRGCT